MSDLANYRAKSGTLIPVWTIEVQTLPEDTDRILDAVMEVHPLSFGRYQRNASISAVGKETAQPEPGSTTTTHVDGFQAGETETYPMVELKISIERDRAILELLYGSGLRVSCHPFASKTVSSCFFMVRGISAWFRIKR